MDFHKSKATPKSSHEAFFTFHPLETDRQELFLIRSLPLFNICKVRKNPDLISDKNLIIRD